MTLHPAQYSELDKVTELYAISEKENRELKTKLYRLQREMAGVAEDAPEASEVRELLELWWKEVMGSRANVAHTLASTRAAKVRAAIRRRKKIDAEHGFALCRKAILGVREDDWAMGRVAKSGGRKFNDIAEHILNTDGDIEKFAELYDKRNQPKPIQAARRAVTPRRTLSFIVDQLLGELERVGCSWKAGAGPDSWVAQCPAHEDRTPSMGIAVNGAQDRLLLICRSCCTQREILDALGLDWGDLFIDDSYERIGSAA